MIVTPHTFNHSIPLLALALLALTMGCASFMTNPPDAPRGVSTDLDTGGLPEAVGTAALEPKGAQPPLPADDGLIRVSVEDAVVLALQNSYDLQVYRLDPIIAESSASQERAAFGVELFAEFEYGDEQSSETSRSTGERFDVSASGNNATAGVRKHTALGTELELAVEQDWGKSSRAPEQEEAALRLSVTQPLLRGLGTGANLARVRQADLDVEASQYELHAFVAKTVVETETAYWRYVLAREAISIVDRAVDVARQQVDEIEQRIEVGTLARTEAAAARAELARREQNTIDAQSQLESRRLQLLRWLNPAKQSSFALDVEATSSAVLVPTPMTNIAEHLEVAQRMRPELNEAQLGLQRNELDVVVTGNGLLPRLDFFANLRKTGYADTQGSGFSELGGDTYNAVIGLQLSQMLGRQEAKARNLAARTSMKQSEIALANLAQLIALDVRLAWSELERARRQVDASAVTRDLQEQTWQAERERYNVGSSTALLVAQAQRELLSSQLAEIEAIVDYRIAIAKFLHAEGALLEKRGIQVDIQ